MADNKALWKLFCAIEKILLKHEAHIFGGYIRDKLLHDYHAQNFYRKQNTWENYTNLEILPEHSERVLIPKDIDCFMRTQQIEKLITSLKDKQFSVRIVSSRPAHLYFGSNTLHELKHMKLEIRPIIHSFFKHLVPTNNYSLFIDITHTNDESVDMYKLLSSNIDFECNSLFITPMNELRLSSWFGKHLSAFEKLQKINEIIEDIISHKARTIIYRQIPEYRIQKMLEKKWIIIDNELSVSRRDLKEPDTCVICAGEFINDDIKVKYGQCSTLYHLKCFHTMASHQEFKNKCPVCSEHMNKPLYAIRQLFPTIGQQTTGQPELQERSSRSQEQQIIQGFEAIQGIRAIQGLQGLQGIQAINDVAEPIEELIGGLTRLLIPN